MASAETDGMIMACTGVMLVEAVGSVSIQTYSDSVSLAQTSICVVTGRSPPAFTTVEIDQKLRTLPSWLKTHSIIHYT